MSRPQEGDEASREDLEEDYEQPMRKEETARAGGDTLGQGAANLSRPRVAKVGWWRKPEFPVHTAVRI